MKLKTIILISLLLLSGVASADTFDIVRPNEEYQDCVGMTVQYCRDNPEYIPCSISNHRYFKISHMAAVKVLDDDTILIHDVTLGYDTYGNNWYNDAELFYHFWIDEPVKRNFYRLWDNRDVVLNA